VAGLLGGIAYLTKSAALPLLLTAPLCFALRKQFRRALLFAAAMLPAVAGWQLWVLTHASRSHDLVTLYYTNYVGFQTYNVTWPDLPRVLWYNLDGFFHSIGKLLLFDAAVDESVLLERIVAFAAIAGVVRLTRRIGLSQYALAALGITALLLIWHYPPDRRFIFPLYPLLAAGLWLELRNFAGALRRAWNQRVVGQRIAAGVGAAALAGLAAFIASRTYAAILRSCRASSRTIPPTCESVAKCIHGSPSTRQPARLCMHMTIRCCTSTPDGAPVAYPYRRGSTTAMTIPA
jgi:hypothetical protein